jgi:hypothetical protein
MKMLINDEIRSHLILKDSSFTNYNVSERKLLFINLHFLNYCLDIIVGNFTIFLVSNILQTLSPDETFIGIILSSKVLNKILAPEWFKEEFGTD